MIRVSFQLETDMLRARDAATVLRDVNRHAGEWARTQVTKSKFQRSAYSEFPGVVKRRTKKYSDWKFKKVGHDIPNVLTGLSEWLVPAGAIVTATRNGGRIRYKAPPHIKRWKEAQRQEFEAMSDRQRERMAGIMETKFTDEIKKPKYARKRRRRT